MYIVQVENNFYIQDLKLLSSDGVLRTAESKLTARKELATKFDLHIAKYLADKYSSLQIKLLKVN